MLKQTRYTALALFTAMAGTPAALGAEDVTYDALVSFGDTESADWVFTNIEQYTVSPNGNIAYTGLASNTQTSQNANGVWADPIQHLPNGGWAFVNRQRLLRTGDSVLNASGASVTLSGGSMGPAYIGDNDIGPGTTEPIIYAWARTDVPANQKGTLFAWNDLPNLLDRTPLLDTGLGTVGGFTVDNVGPRMRANGTGGNLIASAAITGPGLSGLEGAILTFEAPNALPELIIYNGLAVPGAAAPNAAFAGVGGDFNSFINNQRDALVVSAFNSDTITGNVIAAYDHSSSALGTTAYTGQTPPGRPGTTYDFLSPMGLNNSGQLVFASFLSNGDAGIWADKKTGNGVELLLSTGDQAPVLNDPGVTISPLIESGELYGSQLTETGKFFFFANLFSSSGTDLAVYVGDLDGSYELVARGGDPVIGREGATFIDFRVNGTAKGPNASGQITFLADILIPNVGVRQGVFLTDAESRPHLIAIEGEGIPPFPGPGSVAYRLSDSRMPQVADAGFVVYLAESGGSNDFCLFTASVDLFGDIDKNGVRDAADIDALAAAIDAGSTLAKWDMNGDNAVDGGDFDYWVGPIAMTVPGDVDLDGDVDDTDLGAIVSNFTGPGGSGMGWADGDTDGDGDIDDTDIGTAISNFTGPL